MSAYCTHLRAYALVVVAAVLCGAAFNATPHARSLDDLAGWEILPTSCAAPLACTGNNP